jgi:hypothetical protein
MAEKLTPKAPESGVKKAAKANRSERKVTIKRKKVTARSRRLPRH